MKRMIIFLGVFALALGFAQLALADDYHAHQNEADDHLNQRQCAVFIDDRVTVYAALGSTAVAGISFILTEHQIIFSEPSAPASAQPDMWPSIHIDSAKQLMVVPVAEEISFIAVTAKVEKPEENEIKISLDDISTGYYNSATAQTPSVKTPTVFLTCSGMIEMNEPAAACHIRSTIPANLYIPVAELAGRGYGFMLNTKSGKVKLSVHEAGPTDADPLIQPTPASILFIADDNPARFYGVNIGQGSVEMISSRSKGDDAHIQRPIPRSLKVDEAELICREPICGSILY